jgi:hypothetical protein
VRNYLELVNLRLSGLGFDTSISYPGRSLDPNLTLLRGWPAPMRVQSNGSVMGPFPVWFSLLSWLPYTLFGLRGLLLLPLLGGVASAVLAGLLAERWVAGRGWLAVLLTALATPVFFYSEVFWEHTPALAAVLGGLVLMMYFEPAGFAPGLCLIAVGALPRREMLIAQVCGLGWTTYRLALSRTAGLARTALNAMLGAGLIALAQLPWRQSSEAPLQELANASQRSASSLTSPDQGWLSGPIRLGDQIVAGVFNNDSNSALVGQPWSALTVLACLLAVLAMTLHGHWKWLAVALSAITVALPAGVNAFSEMDIVATHGLVVSAPMLLAAVALLRVRAHAGSGLLLTSAILFAAAQTYLLRGGLEWGPRMALLVYPIAAVLIATCPAPRGGLSRASAAFALVLLVGLSVATEARGLGQLRSKLAYLSAWSEALIGLPQSVVLTDIWWLPLVTAPAYYHHQFFFAHEEMVQPLYQQPSVRSGQQQVLWFGGPEVPAWLGPYFEPISGRNAGGQALWIVALRPRAVLTPAPIAAHTTA